MADLPIGQAQGRFSNRSCAPGPSFPAHTGRLPAVGLDRGSRGGIPARLAPVPVNLVRVATHFMLPSRIRTTTVAPQLIVALVVAALWAETAAADDHAPRFQSSAADTTLQAPAADQAGLATMPGSVEAALMHSAEVQSAMADLATAGVEIRIARSGRYPTLQSSVGTGGVDSYDGQVTLSQPLFDWGLTSARTGQARAQQKAAIASLAVAREKTAYDAAIAFIGLRRASELAAAAEDNVTAHQRIAELAGIRTRGGVGDATEAGLASVRLGEAQSSLEDARGGQRSARNVYMTRTGAEPPGGLADVPAIRMLLGGAADIDAAAGEAPAVQVARAREQTALEAAKAERASLFPRLDAEAYVRSYDTARTIDKGVGIRLTGPTFTGFSNFERVKSARFQAESARWQAETARRDATLRVRELIDRTPTLEEQLTILATQLDEARVLSNLYELQFKLGRRSLVDFLNIQADIFRIARTLVNTRYDLFQLQYAAAEGLGRLETSLGLPGMGDPL